MKRKLIILSIIAIIAFSMVACNSNKEGNKIEANIDNVVVNQEKDKDEDDVQEKILKIHNELLPKIKKLYEENNITVRESNYGAEFYDGVSYLTFNNPDIKDIGVVFNTSYELFFNNNKKAESITIAMSINIDENEMKNIDFNIEDTAIGELSKTVLGDSKNIDDINKAINNYYKNSGDEKESFEFNNIKTIVSMESNDIKYTIRIQP